MLLTFLEACSLAVWNLDIPQNKTLPAITYKNN